MTRGNRETARHASAGEDADVELELSVDARRLLEALTRDGTARGNGTLRRELGLEDRAYAAAAEALVRAGLARRGAGRGGSLARLGPGASTTTDGVRLRAWRSRSPAQDEGSPPDDGPGQLLAGPGGLFEKIRAHVPTDQGRGQVFERLIKVFLTEDPLFAERFERVYHWSEWPGNRGERDTGIDLVAEERDGGICAIQCKFYGENEYLPREGINSFLVSSARRPFTSRLWVSTTERWSSNAERVLADQQPPVQRLGVAELEASPFDWTRFDPARPEQLTRRRPKSARPHQEQAIADVLKGLEASERGKLVMACGTGKTFTALRIAEEMVPAGGAVLFCVPSISLLSQSLRAWTADATRSLECVAVCSDTQVTREAEDLHVYDLALPATTRPDQIAEHVRIAGERARQVGSGMVVVFSTYQSLDKIVAAQREGAPVFDLVIADEAHRTTGALAKEEGFSGFTLVHDGAQLRAQRRLYMTATPRLYSDSAKAKARESDIVICSMDDETLYGPELHYLGFGKAVEAGLLSDYRVVVLMVDEGYASEAAHGPLADQDLELGLQDAARLVGCWRGLSKIGADDDEFAYDPGAMRRAVAFSTTIAASRRIGAALPEVVRSVQEKGVQGIDCETRHVDGSMGALIRDQALSWLREEVPEGTCRVLTNARCLSEGVDVPALDAVLFLQPRKSQIDVVQAVGRVMRRAEDKRYGYVVIPIAVPAGEDPEQVLDDNDRYRVVWQVLQALRAHDDRFDAEINKLDLNKTRAARIQVVGVGSEGMREVDNLGQAAQLQLAWQGLEEKVYARVVKHCGSRVYWETWAEDVARIANTHITRIGTAIEQGGAVASAFDAYLDGLQHTINPAVTRDEAIEMLAQHLITTPVFEALFGDAEFTRRNPVSESMAEVLRALHDEEAIEHERAELANFYRSVRTRAENIDNAEGRQRVVKELYEVFFQKAFPKTADRLGIVYTPVELVDFMLRSVDAVLREHFGSHLGSDGVHVLDPFTGTGTFLVRLLEMLQPDELGPAYRQLLHANEIVLLAYYVAAINIEQAYHALRGPGPYEPFPGIVLADTFQMGEGHDELWPEFLRPNSERAKAQQELPITVVLSNPPYSVGQDSENDNNKNLGYEQLDERIRSTYAERSKATLKTSLYDSYVRAFRWASDRIGDRGVVCFVSNGAFIDSVSSDGFRKSLTDEFSAIYCFNLRGNARTSGEQRAKEKGNVFGQGSRTPIAITFLVRDPSQAGPCLLRYHDIGDYLSREDKLSSLQSFGSVQLVPWQAITPNEYGDWINQRTDLFGSFVPLGAKRDQRGQVAFTLFSGGVKTNRDAWAYNFSRRDVLDNMGRAIEFYNAERQRFHAAVGTGSVTRRVESVSRFINPDARQISWTREIKEDLNADKPSELLRGNAVPSMYRPFCKQWLYFDRQWNNCVYMMPTLFPTKVATNRTIAISGVGAGVGYSAFMTDVVPCVSLAGAGNAVQCFPRYLYVDVDQDTLFSQSDGFDRRDAISRSLLDEYRARFGRHVSADDLFYYVYGVLHSPEYRTRFAADLGKMIPRLPMLDAFFEFSEAGRKLADLHVGYESVEPWPLEGLPGRSVNPAELRVEKMRFAGSARKPDRSSIVVNPHISLSGIPDEAYDYEVNGRTALEWILDRYQLKIDKASGIRNDPNDWSEDPRYIVDLVARIVRVSVESAEIIGSLPPLGIR